MKFRIKEAPEAIPIGLKFRGDDIVIVAFDSNGDFWDIITLKREGTFCREEGVPKELGFSLNQLGSIKESP